MLRRLLKKSLDRRFSERKKYAMKIKAAAKIDTVSKTKTTPRIKISPKIQPKAGNKTENASTILEI